MVTQKIHIEAVSDDLSCKTIIERLESVGIFASSLVVKPLNNRADQRKLERIEAQLGCLREGIHSISKHMYPWKS